MVYQAEYPPQEKCESVIGAPVTANNVHGKDVRSKKVRSFRRILGGLGSRTLEEQAGVWKSWSEYSRPREQAVTLADVKANVVVKRLQDRPQTTLGKCTKHRSL